jgi:hypothetical protein
MRYGRYLCIFGCVAVLGVAAPTASAVPVEQVPVPVPVVSPVLQTEVMPAVQQILPYQAIQQNPMQFVPLQGNVYVVSHPGLFWPTDQIAAAQLAAQQLASTAPGWSTTVTNGPQGYGAYLTYGAQSAPAQALNSLVLPAVARVVPFQNLQETPLQFMPLQGNVYMVSHPDLYWQPGQAPFAQTVAQQLASMSPGWGTTIANGPQGYGVYLTYQYG